MAARIHVSSDPEEKRRHDEAERRPQPRLCSLSPAPVTNRIELRNVLLNLEEVSMLARGIRGNKTMRALHLSFNGIGPEGAVMIAEALAANHAISELSLIHI
eukprot:TRINITY_DN9360_c0_g1_i13.p3 TRINITY_DN9360_c0_g1~~TRINITY_DN9360_c0_g1_i13.p3  ORF type:complete len:102 (-),score=28.05 TRINITY_DN9360_c0_g1_i13:148-453(-)